MTVATSTSKSGPYAGAGTTGPFTVDFRFLENSHLAVVRTSTAGVDTTLVLDSAYTVTGAGAETGTVTLLAALAVGEKLTITRDVPATQEADYVQNDAFPAQSHETALDKLTMLVQQQNEVQGRTVKLPVSVSGVSPIMPVPVSNNMIAWNAAANGFQNLDPQALATIVAFGTANADVFTGDGVTTGYTLSANPGALANLDVSIGGVTQLPTTDYVWLGGTSVTFAAAPAAGVKILFRYFQALPQGVTDSAASTFLALGAGAVSRPVQSVLRDGSVNIKNFGAVGDGVANDTLAILAAKAYAIANLPMRVIAPRGTYLYTDIGNWAYSGLTLEGESHMSTVFKCTGAGSAFVVNAFQAGFTGDDATAPYVQAMNVKNITFKGNASTAIIIELQGIARCAWENVWAAEGEPTAGIAWRMHGVQLSSFYNIGCSTNLAAMASKPYEGLRMAAGTRNGVNVGNSSNNTFVNAYLEGLSIGIRLSGADNTSFVSGSSEANSVYDLLVASGSRYNNVLGMGFESLTATANISDGGVYTKYVNCYANKSVLLGGTGLEVSGGFFHRVEMQAAAVKCRVHNVHVKNWESTFPGTGGFVIAAGATGPEWKNVYDINGAAYVYPHRARTGITTGASPFQWQNTTGQYVEVIIQTGTITQIRILRGGDNWLNPIAIPGKHLLAPNDTFEVSWSVSPGLSYVPHNSFQG